MIMKVELAEGSADDIFLQRMHKEKVTLAGHFGRGDGAAGRVWAFKGAKILRRWRKRRGVEGKVIYKIDAK